MTTLEQTPTEAPRSYAWKKYTAAALGGLVLSGSLFAVGVHTGSQEPYGLRTPVTIDGTRLHFDIRNAHADAYGQGHMEDSLLSGTVDCADYPEKRPAVSLEGGNSQDPDRLESFMQQVGVVCHYDDAPMGNGTPKGTPKDRAGWDITGIAYRSGMLDDMYIG